MNPALNWLFYCSSFSTLTKCSRIIFFCESEILCWEGSIIFWDYKEDLANTLAVKSLAVIFNVYAKISCDIVIDLEKLVDINHQPIISPFALFRLYQIQDQLSVHLEQSCVIWNNPYFSCECDLSIFDLVSNWPISAYLETFSQLLWWQILLDGWDQGWTGHLSRSLIKISRAFNWAPALTSLLRCSQVVSPGWCLTLIYIFNLKKWFCIAILPMQFIYIRIYLPILVKTSLFIKKLSKLRTLKLLISYVSKLH